MTPSRLSLRALIERCDLLLEADQYDQLWAYHGMLRAANAELNLTRIHNFESMVLKHYVDSLLVLEYEDLPSPLVDMGSGPGLPGIPLKIARPDVQMILAEPRQARARFLEQTCTELGLEGIEVYAGKVGPRFAQRVRGVITRAVAAIPETLERVEEIIEPGGRMLFMKGPECDEEIARARVTHARTFRLAADHRYVIPGTPHERRLVVYERTEAPGVRRNQPSHDGPIRDVTSDANPMMKRCRDLLTGRGVRKHGQAILAGQRAIAEVLDRFPEKVEAWITDMEGPPPPRPQVVWLRLADALFKEVDVSGTHAPLLLVNVPEMPAWSPDAPWPEGCTLLVPFQDPENVGAVVRSAAAFEVARIVLLREAAHPFHPKASRAAGPALFQVALERGPSLQELTSASVPLIALSADGDDIADSPWPDRFGLVAGLEGPGLPDTLRQGPRRRIPIAPEVESINAATATAIALYEWRRANRPQERG